MKLSKDHERRLADIGGRLPNGKPKLRIVTPDEAIRPHGKWKGTPKYFDPESGKQMECLMLEFWVPPELCGDPDVWPRELMGPFPSECSEDCCNNGYWGLKSPLGADSKFVPFSEATMVAIERQQYMDLKWSLLSEMARQEFIDANLSARNKKADEEGFNEYDDILEDYLIRKEKEDNADNRVFSFGDKVRPNFKNINLPIGRPKINI